MIVQQKTDRPTFVLRGSIASSPRSAAGARRHFSSASSVADYGSATNPFEQRRKATDELGAFVNTGESFSRKAKPATSSRSPTSSPTAKRIRRSPTRGSRSNARNSPTVCSRRALSRASRRPFVRPSAAASDDPTLRQPTPASVQRITHEDLASYAARYWRPDLTTISVVGDLSPQRVRTALETAFGGWQAAGAKPNPHLMAMPAATRGRDYIGTAANQVYIRLGQPAVSRSNPDYDTFLVLSQILGGSGAFESRLWQELRQKRGLVYSVGSSVDADADRGDSASNSAHRRSASSKP